jgi:hypothetical protein
MVASLVGTFMFVGGHFPGQVGNPVGFAATPAAAPARWAGVAGTNAWPGAFSSLTVFSGTGFTSGSAGTPTVISFQDFVGGMDFSVSAFNASQIIFVGCRFQAGTGATINTRFDTGTHISFFYCSITPNPSVAPTVPHAAWPSAAAGTGQSYGDGNYASNTISNANGYQYGAVGSVNATFNTFLWDHCDFWGFANSIDFEGGTLAGPVMISDCWFHDGRNDGGLDHTDGPGYLGGGPGPSNLTITHCTISAMANTDGVAMQGTTYSTPTVTNNYLTGWNHLIRIPTISNGTYTGNTIGTDVPWFVALSNDFSSQFGNGSGNLWRNNKLLVVPGYPTSWGSGSAPTWTSANNGNFLLPDTSLSASDWSTGP